MKDQLSEIEACWLKVDFRPHPYCKPMAPALVNMFLVVIVHWLEREVEKKEEYLERLECFCEFLATVIRQMGISCLTEHLTTLWVLWTSYVHLQRQ